MEVPVRVRLEFDDPQILRKSLRSDGLARSYLLLRPTLATVADVAAQVLLLFRLSHSCPHGLLLILNDFALPPFESTAIFRDEDVIRVKRKTRKLKEVIKNTDDGYPIEDRRIVDKQPVLPSNKVLAIEEFERESGGRGYQNEEEEDEDAADRPEDNLINTSSRKSSPKRKRKHADNLQGSKRKKGKVGSPEKQTSPEGATTVQPDIRKSSPEKKNKCGKQIENSINGVGRTVQVSNSSGVMKDAVESASGKEKHNLALQENGSKHLDDETKLPSRSARRKKAKRQWRREQVEKKDELVQNPPPENDAHRKSLDCATAVEGTGTGTECVPIVVRPGHIRFEPLDEEPNNQKPYQENFQWNGTTDKKKGQKWGRERTSTVSVGTETAPLQVCSQQHVEQEAVVSGSMDFEKLNPLTRLPKDGEVVAYQLLELSSTWCPEISSFRVGRVSSFDPKSMNAVLVPVPEYPLPPKEIAEESSTQETPDPYMEDGSIEIDFTSLINVRLLNKESANGEAATTSKDSASKQNSGVNGKSDHVRNCGASGSGVNGSSNHVSNCVAPAPGKKGGGWEEVDRALSEKKAELMQKDGWCDWSNANTNSNAAWTFRALRRSAIGPTISLLRSGKGL